MGSPTSDIDYLALLQNHVHPALKTGYPLVVGQMMRQFFTAAEMPDEVDNILAEVAEQCSCQVSELLLGINMRHSITLLEVLMCRYDPNPDF